MKFEYELWVRYLCYTHTQSCLPLCDSMDCSLPGSTGYRIFQARILKWVVISSSKGTVPTQGSNPLSHWGSHNSAIVVLSSGFSRGSVGKESTCRAGDTGFSPWVGKIPWRRAWQPSPVFLPGKSHGLTSLAGYSLQGHKKFNMSENTEHTRLQC